MKRDIIKIGIVLGLVITSGVNFAGALEIPEPIPGTIIRQEIPSGYAYDLGYVEVWSDGTEATAICYAFCQKKVIFDVGLNGVDIYFTIDYNLEVKGWLDWAMAQLTVTDAEGVQITTDDEAQGTIGTTRHCEFGDAVVWVVTAVLFDAGFDQKETHYPATGGGTCNNGITNTVVLASGIIQCV